MQIAHECPLVLMEDSRNWTDYDYALAHLFRDNETYFNFFVESIELNRLVILDNGVFETGEAMEMSEYADWIAKLQPTEYIIPDVLEDGIKTIANCEKWVTEYGNEFPYTKIGVVQGHSYEQLLWCYLKLTQLVDKIAFSFDYSFYQQQFPYESKWHAYMLGRQQLLHHLNDMHAFHDIPLHLLGCSLPQEFAFYRVEKELAKLIKTVDTSNPVVHGLHNVRYTDSGLSYKISTKLVEYMNLSQTTPDQYDAIKYNVNAFQEFCNG